MDSDEADYDEVMPSAPSRSRGGPKERRQEQSQKAESVIKGKQRGGQYTVPDGAAVKMIYPNKKFQVSTESLSLFNLFPCVTE